MPAPAPTAFEKPLAPDSGASECSWGRTAGEAALILAVLVIYAGDPVPAINEAHYLLKAKNFWQPEFLSRDAFVTSGKAHATFYATFGLLTQVGSLGFAAWAGRWIGWSTIAVGWQRLSWAVLPRKYASLATVLVWLPAIEHGNLAGEWVVGGIEAKVPAYGFVLFGLAALVRDRWRAVWPLLGAASAFHVLVGGWSVLIAGCVFILSPARRSWHRQLLPLLGGGILALGGLLPALWLTAGTDPAEATEAARIYVYERISHHLLPADFKPAWYARHGALVVLAIAAVAMCAPDPPLRRLSRFAAGAVLLAVIGVLLGLLPATHPDLAARLLRFYWFRLTDVAVPMALAIAGVRLGFAPRLHVPRFARGVTSIAILLGALLVARHAIEHHQAGLPAAADRGAHGHAPEAAIDLRQAAFADWVRVCGWIRDNTNPEAGFLTPRHQQTFKWYARRAEVVNFKDVPQDVPHLRDWKQRFDRVFPAILGRVRTTIQYSELNAMRRDYGAEYIVIDRRVTPYRLPLQQVYPTPFESNRHYAVYRLP